jgi:hypothetical protein
VAVGNSVQVSPCVAFDEDVDGDCSLVLPECSTDSNSEEEYDEDVATGITLPTHVAVKTVDHVRLLPLQCNTTRKVTTHTCEDSRSC